MTPNPLLEKIRAHKLGLLIFDAREASGKSLEDTSMETGTPMDILQSFETGDKIPSLPELEAIAFVLDTPIEHFWGKESLSEKKKFRAKTLNPKLLLVRQKMIGSFVNLKRTEKKLSVTDLCELSGLPEATINVYEGGETPIPMFDLEILAASLEMSVEEFFDQRGAIAKWHKSLHNNQAISELPPEMQEFISKPINRPYLELAIKFSEMPVEKLRTVAESILEITY
jgi:transcriptional regulator with XRE-family HTH domain